MFKKPTTKVIEFRPLDDHAKMFPPKPAKMNLPEWYKNLDSYIEGMDLTAFSMAQNQFPSSVFTVKRCLPVQDYIMSGYTIFTNTEILMSTLKPEEDFQDFLWSIPRPDNTIFGTHPHRQCPISFSGKRHNYIKIYSNWSIKTPPGYSCLLSQPFYNNEDRITFLPAIVDTDTYNDSVGFIGYINPKYEHIKLEAGTPIMNVFPFKREEWKMHVLNELHDPNCSKFTRLRSQFFTDVYRKFFRSKKRFD